MELLSPWPSMQMLLEQVAPLRRRTAAYCPACLCRGRFGRLGWELTFADACAHCGRWLVDTCPGCGELVSWKRAAIESCDCGSSLLNQSTPMAPDSLVCLSRLFELALVGSTSARCDGLDSLAPGQLRDLVRLLGSYGGANRMARPQKRAYSASLATSWSASTIAAEVLATWPRGFEEYLDQMVARASEAGASGPLQRAFGAFYQALYKGLKSAAFDFVRDSFQAYLVHHWTGVLDLRNRRVDAESLGHSKWEPASRARERLALSRARMCTLIATGKVRAVRRVTKAGRTFLLVQRDDIEAWAPAFVDDVTLKEVAAALGFKRSRLASLLPHICPEAVQAIERRSPWAIPRAWVEAWKDRLALLPVVADETAGASFARLLRSGSWAPARMGKFISDIADGSLPVIGRLKDVKGLPGMVFDAGELKSWCGGYSVARSAMTVPEVAKRLCVKQEVAYVLVRRGLLESTTRREGTRKWSSVSDAQLECFNAAYVWCREVALRLRRSPRATATLLLSKGVVQVSGPLADRSRQLLYRRCDVLRAIPNWNELEFEGES